VQDELREGRLQRYCKIPGVFENFYAVTAMRRHPSRLVQQLIAGGHERERRVPAKAMKNRLTGHGRD
jgi:hypothetical protein